MRHNFVNDIGDYAKYALLRTLCSADTPRSRLGVIWYLTEHEERNGDGRHRAHLSRAGWEHLDADLLAKMRAIEHGLAEPAALHLGLIERSGILPSNTVYFSEAMPDTDVPASQRIDRRIAWFARARQATAGCDIVFLDPDNGLETKSVRLTSRLAGKYATAMEVAELLSTGAGVILYQHCDRSPWQAQRVRIRERLTGRIDTPLIVRSMRFGAFGGRAFFCLSTQPRTAHAFDLALRTLQDRVARWDKSHYFLFE